jgi:hypothetical protein
MVAGLGGLAQCAVGLTAACARQFHRRHCHAFLTSRSYGRESPSGGGIAAKPYFYRPEPGPNMLKKRVLLSSGEFHSGSKRATRGAREQRSIAGVHAITVVAEAQFEV